MDKNQITIRCKIHTETFKKFSKVNAYQKNKIYKNPLIFLVVFIAFSIACATQIGKKDGALLLTIVMAILGLMLPIVYILQFESSIKKQCKLMKLDKGKEAYVVILSDDEIVVKPGEDAKNGKIQKFAWSDFKEVWRKDNDMYLYTNKGNAYILPNQNEKTWELLTSHLSDSHIAK